MSDPHYDNVSLLMPMFGANNGTIFTDYSPTPKTITRYGDTKTVTAQSKYYGSSGYFDGGGDNREIDAATGPYLATDASTAADGTPDFTVEFYGLFDAGTTFEPYSLGSPGSGSGTVSANRGGLRIAVQETEVLIVAGNLSSEGWSKHLYRKCTFTALSGWHHIAVESIDNTPRVYIDGIEQALTFGHVSTSVTSFAELQLYVPRRISIMSRHTYGGVLDTTMSSTPYFGTGHIQDLRITKGVARYTADFTPPTQLVGTISGTITDDAGDPAVRTIYAVPRLAPLRTFGPTTSAADGTYSLTVPVTEHSRIVLDDDAGTLYNDLIDRIIPE